MSSEDSYKRKDVSGHFPKYGAIFMSNRSTFKECLEKRLLGLPGSFCSFVRCVKAGMILFLFEFEERKLYGIFEAISDGGFNIVPHAYISSGRKFPAQVKFTTIWNCDPLFKDEFRDALQDNYFDTYKFNFGLSKDQIQSLLWLFDLKRLKIPKSLHRRKKRRSRVQDNKSIEAGLKKGRLTEIQIPERKQNMDHDISLISGTEVERFSLSFYSCRVSESTHFPDDSYDPEHPGFYHMEGSGAHSATSHDSLELVALHRKEGNSNISAKDSEDYIPLSLSDHSDSEEEWVDFSEGSVLKQIELGTLVGNQVSSIPIPQFAHGNILSNKGYNEIKTEHPCASTHGCPRHRADDSGNAGLPLSDKRNSKSENGKSHFKSVQSKVVYSNKSKERSSVFSRLNFSSKYSALKNKNDGWGKLVNDMSIVKHRDHEECEKKKKVTQQKHEVGDCNMNRRTSVFLRLTRGSDAGVQPVHCMTELEEGTSEWKKGKEKK
ncbi:hypothetical protein Fmac_018628 [Flemingia macrophylla]|uniref:DCD domain-containing protein n=1 Tax=Flemingia macrophylla TaxID=520843 RepID=A0ABD1M5I1_9FABA